MTTKVHIMARDSSIPIRLELCIKEVIDVLQLKSVDARFILEIIDPKQDRYIIGLNQTFCVSELLPSYTYCVFQVIPRSLFKWRRKQRRLLFAVTEPDIVFSKGGEIALSDITVYVRDASIQKDLLKSITAFAEFFKINTVRVVLDVPEVEVVEGEVKEAHVR